MGTRTAGDRQTRFGPISGTIFRKLRRPCFIFEQTTVKCVGGARREDAWIGEQTIEKIVKNFIEKRHQYSCRRCRKAEHEKNQKRWKGSKTGRKVAKVATKSKKVNRQIFEFARHLARMDGRSFGDKQQPNHNKKKV